MTNKQEQKTLDMGKIFTGQNYIGHKDNLDIDEIELTGQGNTTTFTTITKQQALSTENPIYLEGIIYQGKAVKIKFSEGTGKTDYDKLEKQILYAYQFILNHYITTNGDLKRGKKIDPKNIEFCDNESCANKHYNKKNLADIVNDINIVRDHDQEQQEKTRTRTYVKKISHIREGHIRAIKGKRYYFPPMLIHPEQYTQEQKIKLGFDNDNNPLRETLNEYRGKEITKKEFEDYLNKNEYKFKTNK